MLIRRSPHRRLIYKQDLPKRILGECRTAENQRCSDSMLIQAHLPHQAVAAERYPVVTGESDDRIIELAGGLRFEFRMFPICESRCDTMP